MCEIKKVKKRYKTEVLKHSKLIKLNITSLAHLNILFFLFRCSRTGQPNTQDT